MHVVVSPSLLKRLFFYLPCVVIFRGELISRVNALVYRSPRTCSTALSARGPDLAGRLGTTIIQTSASMRDDVDVSLRDQVKGTSMASAVAVATAAVDAAVNMRKLEAPDVSKSYVSLGNNTNEIDNDGLPLVYDKDLIEAFWSKENGALNRRWRYFAGKAVPFLTKLITLFLRDGKISDDEIPALSRQARLDLQDLGPTFIKAGQMMSVRPDVLPQSTLDELAKLQDSVIPFDTTTATAQIESELGGPLSQFFTSISEEPVAAASLAQVYVATLADGSDTKVAVKVQRSDVLATVSKDLYVLRRAAEVFQGLIERFAPQQKTNYVALLNEWAVGFYTELDFQNEARNQRRLRDELMNRNISGVVVPDVYSHLCTRRILVSEWMEGRKLSECSPGDIKSVTPIAQEAFLTQLFSFGFFHADPVSTVAEFEDSSLCLLFPCIEWLTRSQHPGNLLLLDTPTESGARIALIDCGLMATIDPVDRDNMVSAVIHLANKNYAALVDDFVRLDILPEDSNRAAIVPLMDKALTPYIRGGGAKRYEEELKKMYGMKDSSMQAQVGGFQAMTQDALTVLNDVPFSIPPYFAILGRAIVTLEGVALSGDPDYGIIMESYPFIARKLLSEDRPGIQGALNEVLYSSNTGVFDLSRLLVLLNNAAGIVATREGAVFVDLDTLPEDGVDLGTCLRYVLSEKAASLRSLLEPEVEIAVDILSRQAFRRLVAEITESLAPPRPPSVPFIGRLLPDPPRLEMLSLPFLLPGDSGTRPVVALLSISELTDIVAPRLTQEEELFALSLVDGATEIFGEEVGNLVRGDRLLDLSSLDTILSVLGPGIKGTTNVVNNGTVQQVYDFMMNAISSLRIGSTSSSSVSSMLTDTLSVLSREERAALDDLSQRVVRRQLEKTMKRLTKTSEAAY